MSHSIPVLWTNDDICFGQSAALKRQLDFLDRHAIPGVFFVIPSQIAGDIDQDTELLSVIRQARGKGHEFYQHGFKHDDPFECGIPELTMLDFSDAVRQRFDLERDSIEEMHSFESMVQMLDRGRQIWRRAFGEDPKGFRPGWGAFCGNLYRGLAELRYEWVSSRIPFLTSWLWNLGRWTEPVEFRKGVNTAPYRTKQGIREFPIAGDYAFRVPNDPRKIDAMVDLGLREFEVFSERGHPMQIVSHFFGLAWAGAHDGSSPHPTGTGYAVHEKLIPKLIETGRARFIGMNELVKSNALSMEISL